MATWHLSQRKYGANLYNPKGAIMHSGDTESAFTIDRSSYEKGDYASEVIELKIENGYWKRIVKE